MIRSVTVSLWALIAALAGSSASAAEPEWPTKAALLGAARAGEFSGLPEIRFDVERAVEPLTDSVLQILQKEYGTPPLPNDRQCRRSAASEVHRLLNAVTGVAIATLSTKPPSFVQEANLQPVLQEIRSLRARAGTGGGFCEIERMGSRQPHPYGAALLKLSDEFEKATGDWVEAERARRKSTYEEAQSRERAALAGQQADRDRVEAERKAAEQKRIDAERARIEADEKRRREQEKKRTAG